MTPRLALLGGARAIELPNPHYRWPAISAKTEAAVLRQLSESVSIYDRSGVIARLEDRLSEMHGVRHAVLTSSGTAALHSMYVALGLKPGDEVICPGYTFFATVTPLFWLGVRPVLVDCNDDGNIAPDEVRGAIGPRTRAIIVTHLWGHPCDMPKLQEIASKFNLPLLEDASHAFGATLKGQLVGSFGLAAAMSLQAQKPLVAGEGGVLLTDSDEIYYRALLFGHYNKRCKQEIPADYPLADFSETGWGLKLRIHPLAAAIAEEQLTEVPDILAKRREIATQLSEGLRGLPGLSLPCVRADSEPSWYAFVIRYDQRAVNNLPLARIYDALHAEGCLEVDRPGSTRPLSDYELFRHPGRVFENCRDWPAPPALPKAHALYETSLKLPVWHRSEDIPIADAYVNAIRKVFTHYRDLL